MKGLKNPPYAITFPPFPVSAPSASLWRNIFRLLPVVLKSLSASEYLLPQSDSPAPIPQPRQSHKVCEYVFYSLRLSVASAIIFSVMHISLLFQDFPALVFPFQANALHNFLLIYSFTSSSLSNPASISNIIRRDSNIPKSNSSDFPTACKCSSITTSFF